MSSADSVSLNFGVNMKTLAFCAELVLASLVIFLASPIWGGSSCVKEHRCGPCRRHWDPVCGSDGKTYSNSCIFACVRDNCKSELEIMFDGECNGQDSLENDAEDREDYEDEISGSSEEEEEDDDEDEEDDDRRKKKSLKYILRL